MAAILALAAALRLWQIGSAPRALHYDELQNGLVALELLDGNLPDLIVQPSDRESLIFYLQAAAIKALGRTPGALRFPTALASVGLVLGSLLLARELFGRKIGLLSGLVCATTLWPVYLGRQAIRPILLPLLAALALFALVRAWRTKRTKWWMASGALFGFVMYSYSPNLFVIPSLLLMAVGAVLLRRDALRRRAFGVAVGLAAMAIIAAPILFTRFVQQGGLSERPSELTVFYSGQNAADFARTAATQSALVLRMFAFKADLNLRHNIPGRPVFDPLMSIFLLLGALAVVGRRYRQRMLLVAGWMAVFLLPTLLSKDAPHFLRASGVLPVLFTLPALGLAGARVWLAARARPFAATLLPAGLLALSIASTVRDYWLDDYLAQPELLVAFDADEAELALELNRLLDAGWTGSNLAAKPAPPTLDRTIWIEPQLWASDEYARFLVPLAPDERDYFRFVVSEPFDLSDMDTLVISSERAEAWLAACSECTPEETSDHGGKFVVFYGGGN